MKNLFINFNNGIRSQCHTFQDDYKAQLVYEKITLAMAKVRGDSTGHCNDLVEFDTECGRNTFRVVTIAGVSLVAWQRWRR